MKTTQTLLFSKEKDEATSLLKKYTPMMVRKNSSKFKPRMASLSTNNFKNIFKNSKVSISKKLTHRRANSLASLNPKNNKNVRIGSEFRVAKRLFWETSSGFKRDNKARNMYSRIKRDVNFSIS